jgi:organic hydroperoxide reductase OsmC/OhrA
MQFITKDYTAEVVNTGGRKGYIKSSDGILDFPVSMPKELGGNGDHTNPEQLFAAGYAACFGGALSSIGKTDAGAFGISAELHVTIPNLSKEDATALVEAAHQVCPYSVATRGNIEVKIFANEQV